MFILIGHAQTRKRKEKGFKLIILPNEDTDHKHLKTKTGLSQKQTKVAFEIWREWRRKKLVSVFFLNTLATGFLDAKLHLLSKHIR